MDRDSAYEELQRRAEAKLREEQSQLEREQEKDYGDLWETRTGYRDKYRDDRPKTKRKSSRSRRQTPTETAVNTFARTVARQLGNQLVRGILGSLKRGR